MVPIPTDDPQLPLLAPRTGLLRAMHPAVSAVLVELPGFFDEPAASLDSLFGMRSGWSALSPDVRLWAHATSFDSMLVGADLLGRPLTAGQQEQAYQDSVARYAAAGLSRRRVPEDLHEFRAYWDRTLARLLEPTEAALALMRPEAGFGLFRAWIARGLIPPEARALLGLEWSVRDERALQGLFTVRRMFRSPLVPATEHNVLAI